MVLGKLRVTAIAVAVVLMLSSCEMFQTKDYTFESNELVRNRSLWEQAGYSSYSYRLTRQGFTPDNGIMYLVHVSGDAVSAVWNTSADTPVPNASLSSFPTVSDLFRDVQAGIDQKADKMNISYDPSFHFPTLIDIDYRQNVADDELSLRAGGLQVAP